uniref:Ig-like domain-containing protein n=1 Tax=Scleropages formosus TaxID=113540 RepID=A0A8C9WC11_SCLFO
NTGRCAPQNCFACLGKQVTPEGVSLTPALKGPFEELLWKYNENKVAEYRAGDGINVFGQFKGRATLNTKTGQLMVRDLRKADSGRYTAEVLMSGTMQDSSFDVKVIDAVTRPTVQCEQRDSVGILRCHSEGEMGQYRWEGPNDLLRNWTDQPIELQVSSSDSAYTCVVKNPVSEESSETFPAEHCFKGEHLTCVLLQRPSGAAHCMRRNSRRNGRSPEMYMYTCTYTFFTVTGSSHVMVEDTSALVIPVLVVRLTCDTPGCAEFTL